MAADARLLGTLVWLLLVCIACRPGETFEVVMADSSMEPTLIAHTTVTFRRSERAARGQVIAFEYPFPYPGRPRRELIARVIGLPGERVQLSQRGVSIDGQRLPEPYAKNQDRLTPLELIVPPDCYFVLGDDRANQRDSRMWGPLPAGKLRGASPSLP